MRPLEIPSAVRIGRRLDDPGVWLLIGLYFLAGYAILVAFFRPKSSAEWLAVLGLGTLWNIY